MAHWAANTIQDLQYIHSTQLTQHPILAVYKAHTIQYKKHMIRDTHNIGTYSNTGHTMLDLNNVTLH